MRICFENTYTRLEAKYGKTVTFTCSSCLNRNRFRWRPYLQQSTDARFLFPMAASCMRCHRAFEPEAMAHLAHVLQQPVAFAFRTTLAECRPRLTAPDVADLIFSYVERQCFWTGLQLGDLVDCKFLDADGGIAGWVACKIIATEYAREIPRSLVNVTLKEKGWSSATPKKLCVQSPETHSTLAPHRSRTYPSGDSSVELLAGSFVDVEWRLAGVKLVYLSFLFVSVSLVFISLGLI
jgi:hypothetical protein